MSKRTSTSLTLPGNPLGSVLREVARESRRSTRDPSAVQYVTGEDLEALQSTISALQDQVVLLQDVAPLGHGRVVSDGSGLLTFTYPRPNPFPAPAVPVIQATPIIADNVAVTVHTVTQTFCTLGVRDADTGAAFPGVPIYITAFPSDIVP